MNAVSNNARRNQKLMPGRTISMMFILDLHNVLS